VDGHSNVSEIAVVFADNLGVSSVDNLVDVQLEDLPPEILLPVPARKLIRMWSTSVDLPKTPSVPTPSYSASVAHVPQTPLSLVKNSVSSWHVNFDIVKSITSMLKSTQPLLTQQAAKFLVDGVNMSPGQRNEVIQCVADDIMKVCRTSTRAQVNVVAESLVGKYH